MSNRMSPFAALTGAEKQMKWLEYQSIRLPYVHSEATDIIGEKVQAAKTLNKGIEPLKVQVETSQKLVNTPPRTQQQFSQVEAQKIRHKQYDAVIARMKQAELNTNKQFTPFS